MTHDEAIALSLVPALSRVGLTERLKFDDPCLIEEARRLLDQSQGVRQRAEPAGIGAIAWNDPRFPSALLAISDAPPALWYRGDLDVLDTAAIAIVGSRGASRYALETAAQLGCEIAARGIAVVSGLARGVDSAAHRGALRSGRTIAVLGSGIDCIYPREHASLADEISQNGLVVSEYPPGTPPLAFHFPMRNRLISGLSRAVVVVEANEKSGSLITAACALDQGRDVMAVPGSVLSGRNRGAHALIRDGAKIVESADDIVEEIGWNRPPVPGSGGARSDSSAISKDPLLTGMQSGHAYDLDELATATGVSGIRLLSRLLELELHGNVQRVEGGRFMRRI